MTTEAMRRASKKYCAANITQVNLSLNHNKDDERELIEFLKGSQKARVMALYAYWKNSNENK